jgi:ubiquinone/menaquinone biosynthesis C-methylase UbiE
MEHREVGRYWNENAEVWTQLSRQGYDTYRDHLNTPAFLEMLPDVSGLRGLDIGCGEGYNTRLLAQHGAHMTAVDIARIFVRYAQQVEVAQPQGIRYLTASAVELPFPAASFDFATGFMSFMDIPETGRVLSEGYRVIKPGGFLQFSIMHPCYDMPHRKNLRDDHGRTYAYEIGNYFHNQEGDVDEWSFSAAPLEVKVNLKPFRVPRFTRTLSQWLNLLLDTGFLLERIQEPCPDDDTVQQHPNIQDAQVIAYFLHVRARKPA